MRFRGLVATLLLPICLLAAAPAAAQSDGEIPAPAITGRVTFFGCTPAASDFSLRAVPLMGEGRLRDGTREDRVPFLTEETSRLPAVQQGALTATTDPHVFTFAVAGVESDFAYQLRIAAAARDGREFPPNPVLPCGRVFWEGPEQGIVFPGVPVSLRGYAPRSAIEVMGTQPAGATRRGWVGADSIDVLNLVGATRQFRWFTGIPQVTGGLVQVSTEQFPKQDVRGRSCAAPPGVIYQQAIAAKSGTWNMVPPLNLAAIASAVALSGPNGLRQYELFNYGAPLYVRVVPVTGRTFRCNALEHGPAPWVVLANAAKSGGTKVDFGNNQPPPSPSPIFLSDQSHYTPPWFFEHPGKGETLYRVIKPHKIPEDILMPFKMFDDLFAYQIAKWTDLDPGDTIPENYFFWYKPGSDGFDIGDVFEGAVSIVTGVVDAVGLLVDQVSKAYDSIKAAVGKVAMSAISATGLVDCEKSEACRVLVETAINSGLAAAGMPPSLPNWNGIVDEGFEYFAAEVVSHAGLSSVPGATELTKEAAQALVNETMKQINEGRGGGGGLPNYLTVDVGQEPAILSMELATLGSTTGPLFPNHLKLTETPALMGTGIGIPRQWREIEIGTKFMKMPIVMRPNLAGFDTPKLAGQNLPDYTVGLMAKQWWKNRLATIPCVLVANQLMVKSGFLALPSSYVITGLDLAPRTWMTFNPTAQSWFPPYVHCTW